MTRMNQTNPSLRRLLPLKPADFMVLAVLQDGPLHGYALSQRIAEKSDGHVEVRPGDLYRVLYRLADQELIAEGEPEVHGGRRRTLYHLTPHGGEVLRAEARRWVELGTEVLRRRSGTAPLEPAEATEMS